MGMMPNDIRFRDSVAKDKLGEVLGHTASGLVIAQTRTVFDGWLYWGKTALVFIADQPIFNGGRVYVLNYDEVKIPTTRFLLYNGELKFESVSPPLVFHSTRGRIKEIEKAIREHFNIKP